MKFVELNRAFLPLRKGEAADPEVTRFWAHKYSGAVYWPELRQYHRVVLLAEASSGKTEEFRNQVTVLRAEGQAAFFVRIEELADEGFEAALDPKDLAEFQKWQRGGTKGWFFLDSLDEARLNKKSFDTALRNLARVLDSSLNRAHIFISCRVSDWNGDKDRASFERLLPALRPAPSPAEEDEDALLDPIFEKAEKKAEQKRAEKVKTPPTDLQVLRITPLVTHQYRLLAAACGVADVVNFSNAVVRNGLDMFTERPGDVIDLASYWNTHKKFGSFEKMTEYAIALKLKEEDAHRVDNDVLSEAQAREGAEMLAAALTFGKSFTLKVPSDSADPELAPGAIDPKLVLKDWLPAQINALSRRAVFAPATYGRIRFHHRATQEYLAAKWLFGLLKKNCPVEVVWALLFAERYGVETVVPSLHPIAGWLALWLPNFCGEIVKREPLVLVRNGDPASLPIATREALLRTFAKKQAEGEIYNDSLDHRALWMFADKQLDKSIRAAWKQNDRDDFRLDLLRLIREGEIYACADLALSVITSPARDKYLHIVAADILSGERKPVRLRAMATAFKHNVANLTSRVAASYVLALFPEYITVKELLDAISQVELKRKDSTDGLGYHLGELYELCRDDTARNEFVSGLAKLCLTPPFVENYKRISAKYYELAKGLEAVARGALKRLGNGTPHTGLVALLTAVERADRHIDLDELPSISEAVRNNAELNRALFWADAHDDRKRKGEIPSIRHWQIYFGGVQLWAFSENDLPWLTEDLKSSKSILDRRLALSGIVQVYGADLAKYAERLRKLFKTAKPLHEDLDGYLAPPKPDNFESKWKKQSESRKRVDAIQAEKNKATWRVFKTEVLKHIEELRDPKVLTKWVGGSGRLFNLTRWLEYKLDNHGENAPREWRLLAEPFSQDVAEAYRDGMKALWRITQPEAPERKPGGAYTIKNTATLSVAGINLEAAEDPDWVAKLTDAETERAFLHQVYDQFGPTDTLNALLEGKAELLIGHLQEAVEAEWRSAEESNNPFLYRFANGHYPIDGVIAELLLKIISAAEPPRIRTLDYGIRILKRLTLTDDDRAMLFKIAHDRLAGCESEERRLYGVRYLAWMLVIDVNAATDELVSWIAERSVSTPDYGEWAFGLLFERHDPIVHGVIDGATVGSLETSLELVYRCVRPEDDVHHEGVFSPGARDAAEGARNTILTALIDRPGADAYRALQRLSKNPAFKMREHRFRELARGKAEKDTEFPAWTEAEVLAFHDKHAAPVKTGQDLLNVISTVLSDIQHGLTKGDVTTRSLLLKASDEEEVKNWLVEQMNFRAKDRFLAYREAEIAFGDMPDTIASSTAAPVAVAFEVKHGGKSWSTNDHVKALTSQLANDYLKPIERRHGVFIISHHGNRTWLHPTTGATLNFAGLIEYLQAIAATTVSNDSGAIVVRVFGLDAAQEKPAKLHRPPPKRSRFAKAALGTKAKSEKSDFRKGPLKSKRRGARKRAI